MIEIVKLGGSLQNSGLLKEWLESITASGRCNTLIVPGGGLFTEQVRIAQRTWRFSDEIAHSMALLGMQQMALLFKGLHPELQLADTDESIRQAFRQGRGTVWSPDLNWLEQCGVPASWDITSDSLAAWLAGKLNAERLILVKSAKIPEPYTMKQLTELGIVDRAFNQFIDQAGFDIKFFSRSQIKLFRTDRF